MANDSTGFRREFVAGVGTVIAAAVAGCSSSDDSPEEDSGGREATPNTATSSPEPTNSPTATSNSTTDEQGSGVSTLIEEDEPQVEAEWEERTFRRDLWDGWIEMENPQEQIPRENYNFEDFPHLQELEELDNYDSVDVYGPKNEAVYILWGELEGQTVLQGFAVADYENNVARGSSGSDGYTEQNADIEGILGEVVEGVDDVPEDLDEEYVELLA